MLGSKPIEFNVNETTRQLYTNYFNQLRIQANLQHTSEHHLQTAT